MHVEGNPGPGGPGSPPPTEPIALSFESVMITLRQRLDDLNHQITTVRETIESRSDRANEISDQIQALKDLKTELSDNGEDQIHVDDLTPEQREQLRQAGLEFPEDMPTEEQYHDASNLGGTLVPISDEAQEIQREYKKGEISLEEIENGISNLNTELQKVNSDNETLMIQLQEAISQRQVQIQLATNSMKAISQGEKQIVRNIGT